MEASNLENASEMEILRQVIQEVATQSQRDVETLRQEVQNAVGQTHRDAKTARQEARTLRQEVQKALGLNPLDMEALRQEIREQTQRDIEALRQELLNTVQRDMKVVRQESKRLRQEAQGMATLRQEWEEVRSDLCTLSDRMKVVAEHTDANAGPPKAIPWASAGRKLRDTCWGISLPLAMTLCAVFGFGIGVTLS
ncbi:ribonuclease Y-like [Phycodurus eques]|uniref:ribonuclease Y-like n=1 Tax=Phycodurus eques TaxID=693459 RepID=UPI002ACECBC9|nr:ribonuclease Y-like [Phycodurus eques]